MGNLSRRDFDISDRRTYPRLDRKGKIDVCLSLRNFWRESVLVQGQICRAFKSSGGFCGPESVRLQWLAKLTDVSQ